MVKTFNSAKIVLNIHVEDDLPYKVIMRTFEATGCGSFLLTDYAHETEDLFRIGEELMIYADENELAKLAKHYLKAEYEREAIGKRSQERAYKEHMYENRVIELINKI